MDVRTRVLESADSARANDGALLAILLNPPHATSGSRTLFALERARAILNYDSIEVINLFTEPTRSVVELNKSATQSAWHETQQQISDLLIRVTGLLGAWGIAGMTGFGRLTRDERAAWTLRECQRQGINHIWMVGGQPRHPSRWHQYVADRHGRCTGGTFDERLAQVLAKVPIDSPLDQA